ncbi:MAG: hypothetical protein AB7G35_15875 [Hyphomicrobiaceae bacterium]
MIRTLSAALTFTCCVCAFGLPASAQMGLDGLHDQRREGGRWCMSDHFHYGTGTGSTRALAERDAIGSWAGFTAWEYGDSWGSWRLAASRSMKCEMGTTGWNCSNEARPCRPLSRSARRRK